MTTAHTWPLGDLIEHTLTAECLCGPEQLIVDSSAGTGGVHVVHHSLDGREAHETEGRAFSGGWNSKII